jgi:cyclic-di-GMP phosphodiesterase TipF (flagellum assembly factor)
MLRITAIFVAVCVVLIAASVGAVAYLLAGFSMTEAGVVALAALTALALYNHLSMRVRDRAEIGEQIADLSRSSADIARQLAELGRRVAALEKDASAILKPRTASDPLALEIGELGALMKQLAETVAAHETRLAAVTAAPAPVPSVSSPIQAPPPSQTPAMDDTTPRMQGGAATVNTDRPTLPPSAPATMDSGIFKGKTEDDIVALIRSAVEANRIDLYLQPILTLPQRKVRYYEAMTRLRLEDGTLVLPEDFLQFAERAGLMPKIDNLLLFRCVQVLRRLLMKNREIGLFCNISASTLNDPVIFPQFLQFMEANRALTPSLMLEFTQDTFRALGPLESESLASLREIGFRFAMDRVRDLQFGPRDLSERGIKFVKVPATLLLNRVPESADIHTADLSDLLGRHGISLIAERIETEAVVVDLLDYDVRFGQGFLFSPPRPVRAEALHGVGERNDIVVREGAADLREPAAGLPGVRAAV